MSRTRLGSAVLATVALALVVLGPASARTPAPAKYGGTLVVGLSGGDPLSLDPTLASGAGQTVYLAMCEALYSRDAKQQLVPVLAAAVPSLSTDKLSYTIQLRKGILFNDGTPFNAQAVVTTVQRYMTYPSSSQTGYYANVKSVTGAGQYTVVFHMKQRDSTFSVGGVQSNVLSPTQLDKLGADFGTKPVCVGPFMFDHRVVGDNVTLIKSHYYYDQKDVYLDKIVYKPMSDASAAAAALKAGDIQALDNVSSTDLDGVRQTSSLRVIQAPQLGWKGVVFNLANKSSPFATSAKLRLAFEEAIDRNALNRVVFDGLYQTTCTPIPPADTVWYDAIKVPCTPYDPRDAKKLVAASGVPNPTVRLLTSNRTDFLRVTQFIQAQEAAVGINVVIDSFDATTATARAVSGNFETYWSGRVPGGPDPDSNIRVGFWTSGTSNNGGYSNPRIDLILANGVKATSIEARSTLYHVALQIIQADRPSIALYNPVTFAAFSANLMGVQLAANGLMTVAHARYK